MEKIEELSGNLPTGGPLGNQTLGTPIGNLFPGNPVAFPKFVQKLSLPSLLASLDQTCTYIRNTNIPPGVLSFQVIFFPQIQHDGRHLSIVMLVLGWI